MYIEMEPGLKGEVIKLFPNLDSLKKGFDIIAKYEFPCDQGDLETHMMNSYTTDQAMIIIILLSWSFDLDVTDDDDYRYATALYSEEGDYDLCKGLNYDLIAKAIFDGIRSKPYPEKGRV